MKHFFGLAIDEEEIAIAESCVGEGLVTLQPGGYEFDGLQG